MIIEKTTYDYGIELNTLDFNGLENEPRISYKPVLRGQGVYLLIHCKKANIRTEYKHGHVLLFSKRKVEDFVKIIKTSIEEFSKLPSTPLTKETQCFKKGKRFLALGLKREDRLITTEDSFRDVIYYQFKNLIPVTQNYTIFYTLRELSKFAEDNYNLII